MKRELYTSQILAVALAGVIVLGFVSARGADNHGSGRGTPNAKAGAMKIHIKFENRTLTATLNDNPTSRDLVSLLPLTLTLTNYAATEKISYLPRRLSNEGAPAGSDPGVGDITYYAPWGNLAIFYKDADYADGLVMLGKIEGDIEALKPSGALKATIEVIK